MRHESWRPPALFSCAHACASLDVRALEDAPVTLEFGIEKLTPDELSVFGAAAGVALRCLSVCLQMEGFADGAEPGAAVCLSRRRTDSVRHTPSAKGARIGEMAPAPMYAETTTQAPDE